jgi:hypothetical protein
MIDFFHHGSSIGFSLNGVSGLLLLFYVLIEICFFIVTKTFLIHKMIMGLRVRNQIKKMLPDWWYIEKISYLTINKRQGEYQVYVKVRSMLTNSLYVDTTNDWVKVNWLGTIKRQSLMASIFVEDKLHENEIKQWSREKNLEKLGI